MLFGGVCIIVLWDPYSRLALNYLYRKISRGLAAYQKNTGTTHPNDQGASRLRLKRENSKREKRASGSDPLTNDSDELWQGNIDVGTPAGTFAGKNLPHFFIFT